MYESSSSSDTGCLVFIQQNNSVDGTIKIKKLVWISDSVVTSLTISPTCDWLALAIRGGLICVLPIGALMNRVQKRCFHWKSNDVTFLPNKLKTSSKVTSMQWWTTYHDANYCLVGNVDGDFLIVDLATGTVLYNERFPDYILTIDLVRSNDNTSTYCIVTSKVLNQWKLLLEECHDKEPLVDNEFGFEQLDFCNLQSSTILTSKSTKKSKEQIVNPAYLPSKMYQFPQSTFLKSQFYNNKYFIGAYDKVSGKYKLFDCSNLEISLFEYQLPLGVLDICVTEDLIYIVVGSPKLYSKLPDAQNAHLVTSIADGAVLVSSSNPQISSNFGNENPRSSVNHNIKHGARQRGTNDGKSNQDDWIHNKKPLKLCIMLRQYSHSHLFESNNNGGMPKMKTNSRRQDRANCFKPSISTVLPKLLTKALLVEFELPDLFSSEELVGCLYLSSFFNFNWCLKHRTSPPTAFISQSIVHNKSMNNNKITTQLITRNFSTPSASSTFALPTMASYKRGTSNISNTNSPNVSDNKLVSKWSYHDMKYVNPVFVISSTGITVCYLSQCLEDKFIDHLVSDDVKKAEWLGVGLRLDMNQLYQFTADLLASGAVKVSNTVTRSTISLIVDFLDLASAKMNYKIQCLIKYLPIEQCLQHCLSLLSQINKMAPPDRIFLSNAMILLFGQVMSDPMDCLENSFIKRNKYYEKFRRFVINNCFFNDLKASKSLIRFGLVEEAFYVAKEKGCVLELFTYLAENNYSCQWANIFDVDHLRNRFHKLDQDFVLSNIGIIEMEIVARSDPKLIQSLSCFICDLFNHSVTNSLSFKTTTNLCIVLNPFGSILDTLFRIYRSSTAPPPNFNSNPIMVPMVNTNKPGGISNASILLANSTDSLTNNAHHQFSSDVIRIRREIGPSLLAYCLLVIARDNLIHTNTDTANNRDENKAIDNGKTLEYSGESTYFIHMHKVLIQFVDKKGVTGNLDSLSSTMNKSSIARKSSVYSVLNAEGVTVSSTSDSFETILRMISSNKGFKPKKNNLSSYWKERMCHQLLGMRDNFCVSVSVFEADLFEHTNNTNANHHTNTDGVGGFASPNKSSSIKCQINMLGFQWRCDRSNRVLLLPKEIECGREVVRQVAVGKKHALILCDNGEVYGAGSNDYGQLGLESPGSSTSGAEGNKNGGTTAGSAKPHKNSGAGLNIVLPVAINLELTKNEQVLAIAAGDYHSGALVVSLTSDDSSDPSNLKSYVTTWGWGVNGQLGHGDILDQRQPKRLAWNFVSNDDHYDNSDNMDSIGKLKDVNKSFTSPTSPTNGNSNGIRQFPVQLEMGSYHSVILTNLGNVYTFGNNAFGQLGVLNIQKSLKPILVSRLPKNITLINTRYFHTVCCNANNEIYTWGISAALWQTSAHQMRSHHDITTPKYVSTASLLANEKIQKISCGINHTTIVTESRLVYTFGNNMFGQLGLGHRREITNLVEVKVPKPIDFIVSDDCVTVAMNMTEKCTTLYTWGKCSHSLITENLRNFTIDAMKPQLLAVYQHIFSNNLSGQNCFGVDTINSGSSSILNKHQLMILFLNFSRYIQRKKLISLLVNLNEIDIVSDYFLMNDLLVESLFWRIKAVVNKLNLMKKNSDQMDKISSDIQIIFEFYIKQTNQEKYSHLARSVLSMICGFFKRQNCFWEIFEKLFSSYISWNPNFIAHLFIKYSLEQHLSAVFIRDLLYTIVTNQALTNIPSSNVEKYSTSHQSQHQQNQLPTNPHPPITLTERDIDKLTNLMQTEDPETVFDAADDHKAVIFAGCTHLMLLGRFRDGPLRQLIERLRKRQMTLSSQAVQRIYGDSSILPECVECMSQRI